MKHFPCKTSQPTPESLPTVANPMSVRRTAALRPATVGQFLAVILIWSFTPLAAVWTVQEIHWAWGLFFRFTLASMVALLCLGYLKIHLGFSQKHLLSYFAGSLGLFGAMAFCYIGAQYVPSGLISMIYGLAPIMSGLISTLILGKQKFLTRQWFGLFIALCGMAMAIGIFSGQLHFHAWGILFEIIGMGLYVISTLWVGKIGADIHPIAQTVGATLMSWLGYIILLPFFMQEIPQHLPSLQAITGIIYSAVLSSVLAMVCYYSLIQRIQPTTLMLTMILTPVFATIWGAWLNDEHISSYFMIGLIFLCLGLALYAFPAKRQIS